VLVDPADAVFESDEGNNFVSAPFEIEPALTYYALTKIVSPEGAGVIDGAGVPNPALILEGEIPSLIPMAAPGWVFVSWGGDATGSDVPFDITMNADTTVIANFQPAPSPAAGSGGGWAALLPAWRASATDPAVALRSD
jgi:uncharacterized repeat protein (TIGR02543 family)